MRGQPAHGFDEFFGNLYHLNAEEEPEKPFFVWASTTRMLRILYLKPFPTFF